MIGAVPGLNPQNVNIIASLKYRQANRSYQTGQGSEKSKDLRSLDPWKIHYILRETHNNCTYHSLFTWRLPLPVLAPQEAPKEAAPLLTEPLAASFGAD